MEDIQNDSLVFYNVVSYNRTILVDSTKDGQHDLQCTTLSSNTSSVKDECEFWLNPAKFIVMPAQSHSGQMIHIIHRYKAEIIEIWARLHFHFA